MTADQPPTVEVVVVRPASLPPSPADAVFSISRIPQDVLQDSQRLDTALASVPGVSLFRRTSSLGANPTVQGIALRGIAGSGSSRALVSLDGVPQNDPFGGWVIWNSLPPETIGEAQVIRGAGSGPYGAGALTGVVALSEKAPPGGDWTLDAEMGTPGQARAVGTAALADRSGTLFLTGAVEHSDGWILVRERRGAADTALTLTDEEVSARYLVDFGKAEGAARMGIFQEERGSGLAGANSRARGASLSASLAQAPTASSVGWWAQAWTVVSDLANTSVSVAPDRSFTTLSNNQYQTPALGYGGNAAVRGITAHGTWEIGADLRGDAGESREFFHPVAGVLTFQRQAGGQTLTGGFYGEVTQQAGPVLLVAEARLDGWGTFDSHRVETVVATGATRLDLHPDSRGGAVPTGRLGARWDVTPDTYLRTAAYAGFRPATLNELFRPFRVGNDITEANANLVPERLYGAEVGAGSASGPFNWDLTGFYNRLDNAIANVTLANGPFLDPVAGFIPANGVLRQRQNIPAVNAYGVEADLSARIGRTIKAQAAMSWTHARVEGGAAAAQLTGLQPAGTPAFVATAELAWQAAARLKLTADLRYESARYDDDQNLRRLNPATTVYLRADWRVAPGATVFIAADNLFDTAVANARTADGVTSYGPPRTVEIGVSLAGSKPRT
jgi:vitamin B12 transporter